MKTPLKTLGERYSFKYGKLCASIDSVGLSEVLDYVYSHSKNLNSILEFQFPIEKYKLYEAVSIHLLLTGNNANIEMVQYPILKLQVKFLSSEDVERNIKEMNKLSILGE